MKDNFVKYEINDNIIGKGSIGSVYTTTDENLVVKHSLVTLTNHHSKHLRKKTIILPNLIEVSIMKSFSHPNLNTCLSIKMNNEHLFIIQEKAICDLHYFFNKREDKDIKKTSYNRILRWMFEICSGLRCLHSLDFIHGDIKCKNILLYYDDTVKLTDFNLSRKQIRENQEYIKSVSTATHKPFEAYFSWSKSLDIWCLGITFYEMVYYKSPIDGKSKTPINNVIEFIKILGNDDKDFINFIDKKRIKCNTIENLRIKEKTTFNSEKYPERHEEISNFIHSILIGNPKLRPDIYSIMSNDIFSSYTFIQGKYFIKPEDRYSNKYIDKINDYIRSHLENYPTELRIIFESLMKKIYDLNLKFKNKSHVCKFITLRFIDIYDCDVNINDLVKVCEYLDYRFFC